MNKPTSATRSAYPHFLPITTRWMDNDVAISYVVE
jgi:acyl-CoA thioester hydrolase